LSTRLLQPCPRDLQAHLPGGNARFRGRLGWPIGGVAEL